MCVSPSVCEQLARREESGPSSGAADVMRASERERERVERDSARQRGRDRREREGERNAPLMRKRTQELCTQERSAEEEKSRDGETSQR